MLGPRKPLGGQYVGAGGALLTPEQVAQQKQVAAALLEQAGDTSPVGHWSAALNRGLQGWLGGRDMYRARQSESEGTSKALERFNARNSGAGAASRVAEALAGGVAAGQPVSGDESGFLASLVASESGGNWNALNKEGYGGRLQFGAARLADAARAGVIPAAITGAEFSRLSPEQQMAVEQWHFNDIDQQAERMGLGQYIGQTVAGIPITREAIRGMAHLGGIGGAAKFLQSGGRYNPADSNGTSLADYALRHGGAGAGISQAPAASNVSEIAALLADPWLPKDAKAVLQAELNQQMQMQNADYEFRLQQQDPMRQIQLQQERLKLEQMLNPGKPRPIEVGGVLLDAETLTPVFDSREAPRPTGNIQEYEYYADRALERGEEPMPFERYQASIARAGSGAASGVGTIPAGYQAITDPLTGQITGLQPIPGGPAELDAEKNAEALKSRETNKANSAAIVAQNIDKAIDQTSGWTAGVGGSILGKLPGSGATDLRSTIDTIRANIGFDRLQQMRDSSPTGGALGGIAIQELQMLQAVLGSLDQSQSPEQLKENLQRLKAIYEPIAAKAAAYPNAKDFGFDGASGEDQEQPKPRRRYNPQTRSFE